MKKLFITITLLFSSLCFAANQEELLIFDSIERASYEKNLDQGRADRLANVIANEIYKTYKIRSKKLNLSNINLSIERTSLLIRSILPLNCRELGPSIYAFTELYSDMLLYTYNYRPRSENLSGYIDTEVIDDFIYQISKHAGLSYEEIREHHDRTESAAISTFIVPVILKGLLGTLDLSNLIKFRVFFSPPVLILGVLPSVSSYLSLKHEDNKGREQNTEILIQKMIAKNISSRILQCQNILNI